MKITADQLRHLLSYCADTGVFTWNIQRGRARVGDVAGYVAKNRLGYEWAQIRLLGVLYPAHRLAWLHHYGSAPGGSIDHINQDSTDNRIENLRIATNVENSRNQHMRITNTSGVTGVYWEESSKKWRAEVKVNGIKNRIGRFHDIHEAAEAVVAFRKCMGFTDLHGVKKRLQEA